MDRENPPADATESTQRRHAPAQCAPVPRIAGAVAAPSGPTSPANDAVGDEDPELLADRKWQAEHNRRWKEANAGIHHPLLAELIIGMTPLHDSLEIDAQIFAERLRARLAANGAAEGELPARLEAVIAAPTRETFRSAAAALEAAWAQKDNYEAPYLAEAMARLEYYAAARNCTASALRTGGRALAHAVDERRPNVERRALLEAGLGWLLWAAGDLPDITEGFVFLRGGPAVTNARELGAEALHQINGILYA